MNAGIFVSHVDSDSSGDKLGMRRGDEVLEVSSSLKSCFLFTYYHCLDKNVYFHVVNYKIKKMVIGERTNSEVRNTREGE